MTNPQEEFQSINVVDVFYWIDEFCHSFEHEWKKTLLTSGVKKRDRRSRMQMSEVMTIMVMFHWSSHRTFKAFYVEYVQKFWRREFPQLVSYNRFVELMKEQVVPLLLLAKSCNVPCSGISFIDSTSLAVCHPKRIKAHKVFAQSAARGKTSMGWFFGFKLHLVINERGEIVHFVLTKGNVADNDERLLKGLRKSVWGKLFGDKGYITKLKKWLYEHGIHLITKLRSNMKNMLIPLTDKLLLRKRAVIESVNDQLKNIFHVEHTRHRSQQNFLTNLFAGLVAYKLAPKKPSVRFQNLVALS